MPNSGEEISDKVGVIRFFTIQSRKKRKIIQQNLGIKLKNTTFALTIVLWCNGSTTVFGSVSGGSNPPGTTQNIREFFMILRIF